MKITQVIPAVAAVLALGTGAAMADQFSGSVAFGASGVITDNPVLSSATDFSLVGAFTTAATGEYAALGVTDFDPVSFNGFTFNPPQQSVTPLWTFDVGSTVFSFDATSVKSSWVTGTGGGEWVITGNGIASITGFQNTPGTFTVNLCDSGNMSVGFDSTADATPAAPDNGTSVGLLGGALVALSAFTRKFVC